jgi:hypothetical protein
MHNHKRHISSRQNMYITMLHNDVYDNYYIAYLYIYYSRIGVSVIRTSITNDRANPLSLTNVPNDR